MTQHPHSPMPPYMPPQHQPPMQQEAPGATAGLVLGIVSVVFGAPVIGLILAYIGFIKSKEAKTLCRMNPGRFSNSGVAEAGYVISIIGMVLGAMSSLCICGYFGFVGLMVLLAGAGAAAGP